MARRIPNIDDNWMDGRADRSLHSAGFDAAKNSDGETEIRSYSPVCAGAFDETGLTTQLAQLRGY